MLLHVEISGEYQDAISEDMYLESWYNYKKRLEWCQEHLLFGTIYRNYAKILRFD